MLKSTRDSLYMKDCISSNVLSYCNPTNREASGWM